MADIDLPAIVAVVRHQWEECEFERGRLEKSLSDAVEHLADETALREEVSVRFDRVCDERDRLRAELDIAKVYVDTTVTAVQKIAVERDALTVQLRMADEANQTLIDLAKERLEENKRLLTVVEPAVEWRFDLPLQPIERTCTDAELVLLAAVDVYRNHGPKPDQS